MKPASGRSKVNNIQALRAYAALWVVSFHTGFMLPHLHAIGSLGVDVFFVISGYIMARICDTNPSFFVRRRLIRILPPYWAFTLLLFIAALFVPAVMGSTSANFGELVKSLLFIPFVKESGLFRPILFVGWSLNYEMAFYLAIAIGLWISRRYALLFASALILAVQLGCQHFGQGGALTRFYSQYYMSEFLFGLVAYHAVKRISTPAAETMRLATAALALIFAVAILVVQAIGFQPLHLLPIHREILCGLLIFTAALACKGGMDLQAKWLILIGDASYVLYLAHPFFIYFLGRVVAKHIPFLRIDLLPGSLFAVALATLLSVYIHLKLEVPVVNYLNDRFGGHRKTTEFKLAA